MRWDGILETMVSNRFSLSPFIMATSMELESTTFRGELPLTSVPPPLLADSTFVNLLCSSLKNNKKHR